MAVRVVENFWTKYYEHKDLIERCFHYLFCRFPNPEGEKDAYSILLTRFFELNVFEKFNRKRLIAKKLGVHKKQLDKIDARGYTDRKLHKMGIDVDKKFEQFIFKYVEHILQEAYVQRQKHMVRFIPNQYLAENPPRNHTALYDSLNESVWAQSRKETEDLRIHIEKKARLGATKFYPCYQQTADYVGIKSDNALEAVEAEELQNKIRAELPNKERRVFDLALEGFKGSDIAESMGYTAQNINLLMQNIRHKYSQYMKLCDARA